MTRIVIAGAGIAGVPAAYRLKETLGPASQVIVVSDRDYFHFVPSNPWVAMGWRDENDIAFPIGKYLAERGIDFVASGLNALDPHRRQVELSNGQELEYDYLLLATGVLPASGCVEGLAEYAHGVIDLERAKKAYAAYRDFVRQPGPIVVGATQHASVLGPMYEYALLVDADLRRRGIRERVPITIVTPEPYPGHLGLGLETETRQLLENVLAQSDIRVICNAETLRVTAGEVEILQRNPAESKPAANPLPYKYCVYWPPFEGIPALRSTPGLTDAAGRVKVDSHMRSLEYPDIFAAGACVAQEAAAPTSVPVGVPDSVYAIQQETEAAVANVLAAVRGTPLQEATFQRAAWLSDLGKNGAAFLAEPHVPLRNILWLRQGRWVHQAKIEFEQYFLNKIRLKSAHGAASTHRIARLMDSVTTGSTSGRRLRPSMSGRSLEVPLSVEAFHCLRALANLADSELQTLAGRLMEAALADAKSYLSEVDLEKLERNSRRLLLNELPESQPGVEFEAGAP